MIEIEQGLVGWAVSIAQTYRRQPKGAIWQGMVTINFMSDPVFDMEVSLRESNDGGSPWVGVPRRTYEQDGQTKGKNMIWIQNKALMAAISECIQIEIGMKTQRQRSEARDESGQRERERDYDPEGAEMRRDERRQDERDDRGSYDRQSEPVRAEQLGSRSDEPLPPPSKKDMPEPY